MPRPVPAWEEIDSFIEAYEKALAQQDDTPLAEFLPDPAHPHYRAVLCELIRADLEHQGEIGRPRRIEDYLAEFPVLRNDPNGIQQIAFEEYRLRQQRGEQPSPAEYRNRFGVDTGEWPVLLADSDPPASPPHAIAGTPSLYQASPRFGGFSAAGLADSAELLAQLNEEDPEAARHFSQALLSLPIAGGEFAGFRLVKELGRGTFGRVYLAWQGDLANRPVALKVACDLLGESQFLARLQHTNIVPVYSVHRSGPLQALCMPYFGSTSLADVLRQLRTLPSLPAEGRWFVDLLNGRKEGTTGSIGSANALAVLGCKSYAEAVLWIGERLADGLAYAHERGILHQDLKPANVLLSDDGTPMLLDFNLSQDSRLRLGVRAAYVGGTLPYMSPEHLEALRDGRGHSDPRSDVYALGLILYELLTGSSPFRVLSRPRAENLAQMIADRVQGAADVRQRNETVSPAAASIVRRCLEPDPMRRYQSARQLHEDLERHLANFPLRFAPEPSLGERIRKWARRHPRLMSGYAVGAVAAVLLLGLGLGLGSAYALQTQRRMHAERDRAEQIARSEAVETHQQFAENLKRARFLLGAPSSLPVDLAEGVTEAERGLERYNVMDDSAWTSAPRVALLPPEKAEGLPGEVRELLLLLARGVRLQGLASEKTVRAERLGVALQLNQLAETQTVEGEGPRSVLLQRALLLHLADRKDEAQGLFEKSASIPARTVSDLYLAGIEQMANGDYRQARDLLLQARRHAPKNPFVCYALGLCHAQRKEFRKAASALDASLALWPDFHASHYYRGLVHQELKEYAEAIAELDEAIRLRPDYLDAYLDRALAKAELHNYQQAEDDATHALESPQVPTRAYYVRAYIRRLAGNQQGAQSDRAEVLRRKPQTDLGWVARGVERMTDDPRGALADLERALEINPRCLPALEDKAAVLADHLGRTEEAVAALDTVLHLAPEYALARAGRAVLLARLGRCEAAIRDAKEAIRLAPDPGILYRGGNVYALTSRKNPADRSEAYHLLAAALRNGFGYEELADDADLKPIQDQPEFRRLLEAARTLQAHPPQEQPPFRNRR
jgi:serine/threonine protein kinase/tetratricopeptide (TPR) repeat protein